MEQKFRITGTLYSKSETREVGAKNYPIREFVIHIPNRENPNYDEYIPFQLKGKNFVDKINGFEKNSFLTVEAVPVILNFCSIINCLSYLDLTIALSYLDLTKTKPPFNNLN